MAWGLTERFEWRGIGQRLKTRVRPQQQSDLLSGLVSGFVAAVSGLIAILSLPTASPYLVLTDLFEAAFNLATSKGGSV